MRAEREWYAVRTKSRRETYAQSQLARRGVETFLPRILEWSAGDRPAVIGPLFPGYLFARVNLLQQYTSIIWAPGVRSIVAFGETPAPVGEEVVAFLQRRCGDQGFICALPPTFREGDWVRVTRGPLEGLMGLVQGQMSARRRVEVLMDLLRRPTRVSVPVELLEHISTC
jgi:transcriptional antiterminator RfaH